MRWRRVAREQHGLRLLDREPTFDDPWETVVDRIRAREAFHRIYEAEEGSR